MILTILNLPHADDIDWPLTPDDVPFTFVSGDRDTKWAKDEDDHIWMRIKDSDHWYPCMTFKTGGPQASEEGS